MNSYAFPGSLAPHGVSTKRKAQAGFAFVFVCLVVIGVISYCGVNRLRNDADLSRHTEEVISSLRLLLSHITDAESSQRGFAITGDENYLAPYNEAQRNVGTDLQFLRRLMTDNTAQRHPLDALAPLVAQRMSLLGEAVELRRNQGFAAVQAFTMNGAGKRLHDEIRRLIGEMVTSEQSLLLRRQADTRRSTAQAKAIIIGGSLLALGVVVAALLAVGKDYTRRRIHAAQAVLAGRLGRMGAWTMELPDFRQTWSDEVCAIHEVPPGTTLSVEDAIGCYASECRATIARVFEDCAHNGTPYDEELQIITPTGRRVWVRSIGEAERDASGTIRRVQGVLQDISARRQGVEALRESETRFRELAENIEEVFWIADPNSLGKIYLSPAYEKIWGRSCQSTYDSPGLWLESVHPDDRERVRETLRVKHTNGAYDEEYRIIRPDGTERWIRDRAFPVRDPDNTIKRWVGVAEDVTQYRNMREQFIQAQKMEALGQFSGGVAHDFNNILAAIAGYTELSQMKLRDNPDVREYLGAVLQATHRATALVRQILTFSRQLPEERLIIELQPVITESLKLLRATIPTTIEFELVLAKDAPTVFANASQIHQVVMNLGINAWHAMKDRPGRLRVKLDRCVVDEAHAVAQLRLQPGVYARISVSDTGSGMDAATQRRLFEPFFTTKPPGEGTGLGLAVVHGIMESHDGAVTVYSQPGEGTVFHLYFPAHVGEAVAISGVEQGPTPRGQGERILIVDDEEMLAKLGQKTLSSLGYTVEITTQPETALKMVRADPSRFALVITDQTMPMMTGLVLAAQLHEIQPKLAILLITGHSASLTRERIEAAGVYQLLFKPTGIHALGTAVHASLSGNPPDYGSHPPY